VITHELVFYSYSVGIIFAELQIADCRTENFSGQYRKGKRLLLLEVA
jgi:hypothetical protein